MADETDPIRDALNRHGVFLKKAVLDAIPSQGLEIFEEIASSFGGATRSADIVIIENFRDRTLYLVIECKRVADDRQWIFFQHRDSRYRVARKVGSDQISEMRRDRVLCCSEGYEYPLRGDKKNALPEADQDPVHKAGNQLSTSYLGFVYDHWRKRVGAGLPPKGEWFVPILITTARLSIVQNSFAAAPLSTGRLDENLVLKAVPELILKHPFATPQGIEDDFRGRFDPWEHRSTESLYVVRADSLAEFLDPVRREGFAGDP